MEKIERNEQILEMFNDGYRAVAIAKKLGISRARVYQILDRMKGKKKNEKFN